MAQWYVAQQSSTNKLAVKQLPLPNGWLTLDGPFTSRAKAELALIKDQGGNTGGGHKTQSEKWWVITGIVGGPPLPNGGAFDVIQSANRPSQFHVVKGPFATQADANAALNKVEGPGGLHIKFQAPSNPLDALGNVGDFFGRLAEPSTWIRVGEVIIGGLALGIGLYVMVKDTSAGKAVKRGVKNTAKVAAMIPK